MNSSTDKGNDMDDRLVRIYHRSADRHARRINAKASDALLRQAYDLSRRILVAIEQEG